MIPKIMKLCFASNNHHKLEEISLLVGDLFEIISPKMLGCTEEIPEDFATLEENSLQKATFINQKYHIDCFADDSGLEVEALNGAPGAFSAMYAGTHGDHEANNALLLRNLEGKTNRNARFRTCITLIKNGQTHQFQGVIEGEITTEKIGEEGFGYNPLFVPKGHQLTFAQMNINERNTLSHRAKALLQLVEFLKKEE